MVDVLIIETVIGTTYTLQSATGTVIATGKTTTSKQPIPMYGLPSGLYILALNENRKQYKIVKQ